MIGRQVRWTCTENSPEDTLETSVILEDATDWTLKAEVPLASPSGTRSGLERCGCATVTGLVPGAS